ncbi:MAG: ribonuclease HI family protein [Candidatus Levyibacteriota bacterium]
MDKRINIFTDGGARGNPGPAAIGVYVEDLEGKVLAEIGKTIGITTNNVAEYKAVIEALDWMVENQKTFPPNVRISFFLDSLLVCSQIKGIYRVKDANLKNLMILIREREANINHPISYAHVPREQNKNADRLVNHALDQV